MKFIKSFRLFESIEEMPTLDNLKNFKSINDFRGKGYDDEIEDVLEIEPEDEDQALFYLKVKVKNKLESIKKNKELYNTRFEEAKEQLNSILKDIENIIDDGLNDEKTKSILFDLVKNWIISFKLNYKDKFGESEIVSKIEDWLNKLRQENL
jgi:predicted transcriptional regulator